MSSRSTPASAMKVLYVGNVVPAKVAVALGTSVAGNQFEISFARALDRALDGNLDVISAHWRGRTAINKANAREIFPGKTFTCLAQPREPILDDVVRNAHFLLLAAQWCLRNIGHKRVILILNAPLGICVVAMLARLLGVRATSIVIDTPFSHPDKYHGLLGCYIGASYRLGHYVLRFFSGIVVLNKAVVTSLKLRIPHLVATVGFDEERYASSADSRARDPRSREPRRIVYAGTLIDYNGVVPLAEAIASLDGEPCELHVYGSGPLEGEIAEFASQNPRIVFHGQVEHRQMLRVFAEADLLVNPRVTSSAVCDFTFPSKLTEYLLSGRPVLTTRFSSLPADYEQFVFLIEDETPAGMAKAVRRALDESPERVVEMCREAKDYVWRHQRWQTIGEDVCGFLSQL